MVKKLKIYSINTTGGKRYGLMRNIGGEWKVCYPYKDYKTRSGVLKAMKRKR